MSSIGQSYESRVKDFLTKEVRTATELHEFRPYNDLQGRITSKFSSETANQVALLKEALQMKGLTNQENAVLSKNCSNLITILRSKDDDLEIRNVLNEAGNVFTWKPTKLSLYDESSKDYQEYSKKVYKDFRWQDA